MKVIWLKMRYSWPQSLQIVGNHTHCSSVDFWSGKILSANVFLFHPKSHFHAVYV